MILRALVIAAMALGWGGTGALADTAAICSPARNATFAVTGVARNDRLNMRASPVATDRIVAQLAYNARNVRFDGEVSFASSGCRNACFAAQIGIAAADLLVRNECLARSNLWYRVRDGNGNRGWVAARFLSHSTAAPAPQPPAPPAAGDTFRFSCDGGGRITLTVRERIGEASFVDHLGTEWRLIRERGMAEPIAYRGMDNNREMFVRGDRRQVRFSNARGNVNTCRR
jgi:hypothetical protein